MVEKIRFLLKKISVDFPNCATYSNYKVNNLRELLIRHNIVLVLATANRHEA